MMDRNDMLVAASVAVDVIRYVEAGEVQEVENHLELMKESYMGSPRMMAYLDLLQGLITLTDADGTAYWVDKLVTVMQLHPTYDLLLASRPKR